MLLATGAVGTEVGRVAVPVRTVTSLAGTVWPVVSSVTQWAAVRICVGSMTTPPQKASVPVAGPSGWAGVCTKTAA